MELSLDPADRAVAHGLVGGLVSVAGGGNFGSGFLAGGIGSLGPSPTGSETLDEIAEGTIEHAVLGGLGSLLGGGKFQNGAITGAFAYLFNERQHAEALRKYQAVIDISDVTPGEVAQISPTLSFQEWYDKVRTNGAWDIKDLTDVVDAEKGGVLDPDIVQEYGNFIFGVSAEARGYGLSFALEGAGGYQLFRQGYGRNATAMSYAEGIAESSIGGLVWASQFAPYMPQNDLLAFGLTDLGFGWADNPGDSQAVAQGWLYGKTH